MAENHNLPVHIAVIPDGNRRWAKELHFRPWFGHAEGVKRFEEIAAAIFKRGIPYFTFWAASVGNLTKRDQGEVGFLVTLMKEQLKNRIESAEKDKIKVRILGRGKHIITDEDLCELISELEKKTANYHERNLTILFGYDGFEEMTSAVKNIISQGPAIPNYEDIKYFLWTRDLPPVDLVIRTGETQQDWAHNSAGFMMWLTGNSRYYYPRVFWPDFNEKELDKALEGYAKEERRFGA